MNDTTFQGNGKIAYVPVVVNAKPPKQSNYDRIRAMTDEELAEWLDRLITHCNDGPCFNCFMQEACLTSVIDWLKQEVNANDS